MSGKDIILKEDITFVKKGYGRMDDKMRSLQDMKTLKKVFKKDFLNTQSFPMKKVSVKSYTGGGINFAIRLQAFPITTVKTATA